MTTTTQILSWLAPTTLRKQCRQVAPTPLTAREVDVVAGVLEHRNIKAIAKSLHLSPKTIQNHLSNINLKLDCTSQKHLIAYLKQSKTDGLFQQHGLYLQLKCLFSVHLTRWSKNGLSHLLWITPHQSSLLHDIHRDLQAHLTQAGWRITEDTWDHLDEHLSVSDITQMVCELEEGPSEASIDALNERVSQYPELTWVSLVPGKKLPGPSDSPMSCIGLNQQRDFYELLYQLITILLPQQDVSSLQQAAQDIRGSTQTNLPTVLYQPTTHTTTKSSWHRWGALMLVW